MKAFLSKLTWTDLECKSLLVPEDEITISDKTDNGEGDSHVDKEETGHPRNVVSSYHTVFVNQDTELCGRLTWTVNLDC